MRIFTASICACRCHKSSGCFTTYASRTIFRCRYRGARCCCEMNIPASTCGIQPGRENLTIDHVIPRSRGGRTEWENVVAACGACNRRKGNRTPDEANMKMQHHPHRPRFWAMALLTMANNDVWRKYLGPNVNGNGHAR